MLYFCLFCAPFLVSNEWGSGGALPTIFKTHFLYPSPQSTHQHCLVCCFFPKNSWDSVCSFLAVAELWTDLFAENIFSCCVSRCQSPFHPDHKCTVQSDAKQESGEGWYIPQDGQLFHLHEEEESVRQKPALKGKILSLFSWLWGRKQSWCKSHASLGGHSPHKRLPLQCDGSDHGQNFSSPTPMKMWAHSTVCSWDVVVSRGTDSFRNKG